MCAKEAAMIQLTDERVKALAEGKGRRGWDDPELNDYDRS